MADTSRKRVAVIGAGVAGLTAAWLLRKAYEVSLLERNDYLGGHTRTLTVAGESDHGTPIDTGFIVMNRRNYPLFSRLLDELGVGLAPSCMSFSFHDKSAGYAYGGTGPGGMFAQPRNLVSPSHWAMIRDILRFGRVGTRDLADGACEGVTLGEYLERHAFGLPFQTRYLLPMGAAIWSSPLEELRSFPAQPFLHFMDNHGLLTLRDRPPWQFVEGGSRTYVERIRQDLAEPPKLSSAARTVRRKPDGIEVIDAAGRTLPFDHVVLATHADDALHLLETPTTHEAKHLGAWRYQDNQVVLHTDESVMPPPRRAWASWNFEREPGAGDGQPISVSYHMNRLQRLRTEREYFVTLNRRQPLKDRHVLDRTVLRHPLYSFEALSGQPALRKRNGEHRTWFCGSYFGYGFHEDAVRSAVEVARGLGVDW